MNTILIGNECFNSCNNQPLLKGNYLSEFTTSSQKEKARRNLGITDTVEWGNILGNIKDQRDLISLVKCIISNEVNNLTDNMKSMLLDLISKTTCNCNNSDSDDNSGDDSDDNSGDDSDDNSGDDSDDNSGDDSGDDSDNNSCNCSDGNWALIFKATSTYNPPSLPTTSDEIEYQMSNIVMESTGSTTTKWTDIPSTDSNKYIWMAMLWEVFSEDDEETSEDDEETSESIGDWKGPYLMRFPQSTSTSDGDNNTTSTYVTDVLVTSETSETSNFKAATVKVTKNTSTNPTTTTTIYVPTIKNVTLGTSGDDKNKLKITLTNGSEFTCDLSNLISNSESITFDEFEIEDVTETE